MEVITQSPPKAVNYQEAKTLEPPYLLLHQGLDAVQQRVLTLVDDPNLCSVGSVCDGVRVGWRHQLGFILRR